MAGIEQEFDDLLAALPGMVVVEEDEPDNAIQRVARRIAGQHGEILLRFSKDAFAFSDVRLHAQETLELTKNLVRLARAAGNDDQVVLLESFARQVLALTRVTGRHPSRTRALAGIRDWIPRFSDTLDDDQAKQMMEIVQPVSFPLRKVLKKIPGVGAARLTRMYAAGLHTLESLANGSSEEIAAVTGMPLDVARRVVQASHDYAREERLRCIEDMQTRTAQFERILGVLPADADDELRQAARDALVSMRAALTRLNSDGK